MRGSAGDGARLACSESTAHVRAQSFRGGSAYERETDIEVVAVNDVVPAETLAALLARDSVYGRFPGRVRGEEGLIRIDDDEVVALSEREPSALPWRDLGVDVVIESTGRFRTRTAAAE